MANLVRAAKKDDNTDAVDRLLQEINLLNLERYLFSTDRKRTVAPGSVLEYLDKNGVHYKITVGPYGVPRDLCYRIWQATLFKVVSGVKNFNAENNQLRQRVSFAKRELTRLCGLEWRGGDGDSD